MNADEILRRAFAMPLGSPSYPPGLYRFYDREYVIISYRTDSDALRAIVPEPLQIGDPIMKYEFIRMPNSTGFGDDTESGQVIPVTLSGIHGGYTHSMYLDCDPPIAGGRELWGFPKKLGRPTLHAKLDTLVGTLDMGPVRVATGSMGFEHQALLAKRTYREPWLVDGLAGSVFGAPIIAGFLILSWVCWHVTRWVASMLSWVEPANWAMACVTLLSSLTTAFVLFLLLRNRQQA